MGPSTSEYFLWAKWADTVDLSALADSGATAVISAMATDAWSWVRGEVASLLTDRDANRERQEVARLDGFAGDLSNAAERDVHNRLLGYLEARIGEDAQLQAEFLTLIRQISLKIGIEPPLPRPVQQVVTGPNSIVVQTSGGLAHVQIAEPVAPVIRWAAMTGPEAARRLESMSLEDAAEAITDMEPTLAARRLTHIERVRAVQMLSHIDEGVAAELLSKLTVDHLAAALLAHMEPAQAAAILDMTVADWTVARLAEMDPARALALLAVMGQKRTDDLLAAMARQQAVTLLGAVGKLLTDQNRVRVTIDLAQQEAERIAHAARQAAQETVEQAAVEAQSLRSAAEMEADELRLLARREIDELRRDVGLVLADPMLEGTVAPLPRRARPTTADVPQPRHRASADALCDWATPQPPFGLAIAFFLISLDSDGRHQVEQDMLETVCAGAVLCDLAQADLIDPADGRLRSNAGADCVEALGEPLSNLTASSIQQAAAWIRDNRREIFVRLAQLLTDTEAIVPVLKRSWRHPGVTYRPADGNARSELSMRVVRSISGSADPDDHTYLLAALLNVTRLHRILPMVVLKPKQTRQLLTNMLSNWTPATPVHLALQSIEAALATATMTPRIR